MKSILRGPVGTYIVVFVVLLALLAATVGASLLDLGPWNIALALAVACVKAALIVWFFMHIRETGRTSLVFAAAGVFWLAILIVLSMADFLTRGG